MINWAKQRIQNRRKILTRLTSDSFLVQLLAALAYTY